MLKLMSIESVMPSPLLPSSLPSSAENYLASNINSANFETLILKWFSLFLFSFSNIEVLLVYSISFRCTIYWFNIFIDWGFLGGSVREGNGNPLQCSCLENPRDSGAWWAAICGVAQNRTRLKRISSSSSSRWLSGKECFCQCSKT